MGIFLVNTSETTPQINAYLNTGQQYDTLTPSNMEFINSTNLVLLYNYGIYADSVNMTRYSYIGFLDVSTGTPILTLDVINGSPYTSYGIYNTRAYNNTIFFSGTLKR